ncbi:hypothetical protein RRF57_008474 [Xylaria bambusicola]|uniref:GH18 domain-containing protein n=1 Tax=Xylaria bambusicola TaxID=326684 RepID=A0AAN7UHX6_9PEZI
MLNGAISFDWINIQFYNNWCGVVNFANPNAWNFNVWDDWAHKTSKNPNVKVLIGVPASQSAGGGYVSARRSAPSSRTPRRSTLASAVSWPGT